MSTHQLPDLRWICKYKDPSTGKIKKEYFGRGPEAEAKAIARNAEACAPAAAKKSTAPRFDDLAYAYLAAREATMAPSTWRAAVPVILSVLIPAIGHCQADAITHQVIDAFVAGRKKNVKNITIQANITYLQAILNHAVQVGLILFNPARGYKEPPGDGARQRPPSMEEIEAIMAVSPPHMQRAVQLAYFTACRPGRVELLGIRWEDVDLFGRTITIVSAKKGGLPLRDVPIAERFLPVLRQWQVEDAAAGQKYLIHYQGRRLVKIGASWMAALKRAGITRRIRLYDIRHAAASKMLDGGDLKSVSKILGHRTVQQTIDCYQHISDGQKRDAVSRL